LETLTQATMDRGSAITNKELAYAKKSKCHIVRLTAKVRQNVQYLLNQRQPDIFWMRAFPCES